MPDASRRLQAVHQSDSVRALKKSPDSRVCWWLLLGYVLAAPYLPLSGVAISWDSVTLMDWQRLLELAVLFACLVWAIVFAPPLRLPFSLTNCAWAALFLLGLLSALAGTGHVEFALLEWSMWLALITLVAMMRQWPVMNRDSLDRSVLVSVLIGGVAYVAWFWSLNAFSYFAPEELLFLAKEVSFPGFSNIRIFSDYQSFMLFLLPTALYRLTEKGLARTLGAWLVGLYFALALIAGSRSVIATHLVLHAMLWVLRGNRYKPFALMQLRFWAYGCLFFYFLTWILPLILPGDRRLVVSSLARADSSLRSELWTLAWQFIQSHPWLGIGPMQYAAWPNGIAAHPHNLIMQFAAEWGVPATLLLVWLVWMQLSARFRILSGMGTDAKDDTAFAMTCAGAALIIQSMVSGVFIYPTTQLMAVLLFAYPLNAENQNSDKRTFTCHYIAVFALGMLVANLTTLPSIRERNHCFLNDRWPTRVFAPRFWQQGWITGVCGEGDTLFRLPRM